MESLSTTQKYLYISLSLEFSTKKYLLSIENPLILAVKRNLIPEAKNQKIRIHFNFSFLKQCHSQESNLINLV